MSKAGYRYLIIDIGGTNIRIGCISDEGEIEDLQNFSTSAYDNLTTAISDYLHSVPGFPTRAVISVAAPYNGEDKICLTNINHTVSISEIKNIHNIDATVVNDFTAQAMALNALNNEKDCHCLQADRADQSKTAIIMGAGTGFGLAVVEKQNGIWIPKLATEAGHDVLTASAGLGFKFLQKIPGRSGCTPSTEDYLSGPGLQRIYEILYKTATPPSSKEILARAAKPKATENAKAPAKTPEQNAAIQVVRTFCSLLGTKVANATVQYGAVDAIYFSSGVIPGMQKVNAFQDDAFAEAIHRIKISRPATIQALLDRPQHNIIMADEPGMLGLAFMAHALSQNRICIRNGKVGLATQSNNDLTAARAFYTKESCGSTYS